MPRPPRNTPRLVRIVAWQSAKMAHRFRAMLRFPRLDQSCPSGPQLLRRADFLGRRGFIGQMLGFQLHAMGRCAVNQGMRGDCPRRGLNPAASPYRSKRLPEGRYRVHHAGKRPHLFTRGVTALVWLKVALAEGDA